MQYQVMQKGRSHYVVGLTSFEYEDTILIYHYPQGDIDTLMSDKKMMHGALYDLFQVNENLKQGDTFVTQFGNFECRGVHVVSVD